MTPHLIYLYILFIHSFFQHPFLKLCTFSTLNVPSFPPIPSSATCLYDRFSLSLSPLLSPISLPPLPPFSPSPSFSLSFPPMTPLFLFYLTTPVISLFLLRKINSWSLSRRETCVSLCWAHGQCLSLDMWFSDRTIFLAIMSWNSPTSLDSGTTALVMQCEI